MHRKLLMSASVLAVIAVQPLAAQNFYVGLGAEFGNGQGTGLLTPDTETSAVSVIAGARYTFANNMFAGGEIETALTNNHSVFGSDDELDSLSRARVLVGYDFGQFAAFGAYGLGKASGPVAGNFGTYEGKTWGVGGEYALNDRFDLRVEAIRDDFEIENNSGYGWENSSVRAAAVVKF